MNEHRDQRFESERGDPTMIGRTASRLRLLSRLDDYEIADGEPDIRGWRVFDANGNAVGTVHDLVVDMGDREVRYLDLAIDGSQRINRGTDREHVLVPIGSARLSDDVDAVTLTTVDAARLALLPRYDHETITRDRECELQGRMMGLDGPAPDTGDEFYRQPAFDAAVFWGVRRAPGGTAYVVSTEDFRGGPERR